MGKIRVWAILIAISNASVGSVSASNLGKQINIYCISNLDGTGSCYEVKTNELVKCIDIPGDVIPCKTDDGKKYNCIWFSSALFNCIQVSRFSESYEKSNGADLDKQVIKNIFGNDLDGVNPPPSNNGSDSQQSPKADAPVTQTQPKSVHNPIKPVLQPAW